MEKYLAGTPTTIIIPLADRYGNPVAATAVECEIVDGNGAVKVARAPLTMNAGDTQVEVTVPADANGIADATPRELRTVKLYCTVNGGSVTLSKSYVVEADALLIVGVNSFQTLEQAEMLAMGMMGLGDWDLMDDEEKVRAMIDSRIRICRLSFDLLDLTRPQENVQYVPEGLHYRGTRIGSWNLRGELDELNAEQFNLLPQKFKTALCYAQLQDAADTLSPDPVTQKRAKGLILDTIGETKQMFSSARPVTSPVSRAAMAYLSEFVTTVMTTGRAG